VIVITLMKYRWNENKVTGNYHTTEFYTAELCLSGQLQQNIVYVCSVVLLTPVVDATASVVRHSGSELYTDQGNFTIYCQS